MDNQLVKDILPAYYKKNRFDNDGGESSSSVEIKMFKGLSVYLPNFNTRKKAILKHDIHHIITGYKTDFKSETEISAWEISTGCRNNWAAFVLNTFAVMTGVLLLNFNGLWKAWVLGKHTNSLYYTSSSNSELKNKTIGELKKELGFMDEKDYTKSSPSYFISFFGFLLFGVVFSSGSLIFIPFIIIYSLIIYIRKT